MPEPRSSAPPVPAALESSLREHRAATERRMVAALDRLSPGWSGRRHLWLGSKPECALLHHTFYETRQALREGDRARARSALGLWEQEDIEWAPAVSTAAGAVLITAGSSCRRSNDDRFLSPLYTVTGAPAATPQPLPEQLLQQGVDHVVAAGLGLFPAASLAVVVVLAWRSPTGTTHSHSVTALPGTVFADWTDDPVRWGEILLHESSHSWLNECFRALDIRLPLQPTWFSEWKRVARPAYGLLHAAFAFSLMVRYFDHFARISARDTTTHRYCATRLRREHRVLARMEADVREAAALVPDERLRSVILGQLELALDSSGPGGANDPARRQERSITV